MARIRIEQDTLGQVEVPADALYGAETARAVKNFPISGLPNHRSMVKAIAAIKWAAAEANRDLGVLDRRLAGAIIEAAREIYDGSHLDQFPVDVFQAGAGTSFNMNANEVIANRANELLGAKKGTYVPVGSHDQVNASQSTNDVFPTATRVAGLWLLGELDRRLAGVIKAFKVLARRHARTIKTGRTHLQDAVPTTFGRVFGGFAHCLESHRSHLKAASASLQRINLGATAIGTGINAPTGYAGVVARNLSRITALRLRPGADLVELTQSMGDVALVSATVRTLALDLIRIANDLRLLGSGPNTGLGEIALPAVQPGSSIMPDKVNPVIAEMLDMVCFQVIGNDHVVAMAAQAGQLELNVMMPVMAYALLFSLEILTNALAVFAEGCVSGITVDVTHCRDLAESSAALATALAPKTGYAAAATVARKARKTGKSLRRIISEEGLLSPEVADRILDLPRLAGVEAPRSDTYGTRPAGAKKNRKRRDHDA